MKIKENKSAFSILVAIFMIGFLLILVIGTYNLILNDMKDNRGSQDYIKAYAGAEGAMELGLLEIKKNGYAIDKNLSKTNSGILSFNSSLKNNDPRINYKMLIAIKDFSGKLDSGETVIIPLFSNSIGIRQPVFTDKSSGDIIWNIIGNQEGMSGTGSFVYNDIIKYKKNNGDYEENNSIEDFLTNNTGSYLMLFNRNPSSSVEYNLKGESNFSKPVGTIISSVKVGRFKQNISTNINNTKFLNMLKYSLYSK